MEWVRRLTVTLLAVSAIAALAIAAVAAAWPRERSFTVVAQTETARISVTSDDGIATVLPWVRVDGLPAQTFEEATLRISSGSVLTLTRQRHGDLFVFIESQDAAPASLVTIEGEVIQLQRDARLAVSLDRTALPDERALSGSVLLPFRGSLELGADIANHVRYTLLSARIMIVESQPLSSERFVIREAALDPGDRATWLDVNAKPAEVAGGFAMIGEDAGIGFVAHAAADHLRIDRLGAASYVIRPSVWDRLAKDPVVSTLIILIGVLGGAVGLADALFKAWSRNPAK